MTTWLPRCAVEIRVRVCCVRARTYRLSPACSNLRVSSRDPIRERSAALWSRRAFALAPQRYRRGVHELGTAAKSLLERHLHAECRVGEEHSRWLQAARRAQGIGPVTPS